MIVGAILTEGSRRGINKLKKTRWEYLRALSFQFVQFDEIPENLATIAFVPGVEAILPVTGNWELKPFYRRSGYPVCRPY